MDITKKDLLLLPSQSCPKVKNLRKVPFVADPDKIKFLLNAGTYKIDDRRILKATLFWIDSHRPAYLLFCDRDEDRFWTYDVSGHKWSNACLHNLVGERRAPMLTIANVDKNIGARYFNEKNRLTSYCILDFQFSVRNQENCGCGYPTRSFKTIRQQYEDGQQFLEAIMEQSGPLPHDIHQFVDTHVLLKSRYIYYTREKKRLVGYCTHCHSDVVMPLPKIKGPLHNKTGICPKCHSHVTFKAGGRASKIKDYGRFEYIQRIDDGLLIRSFCVTRHIEKDYLKGFKEYYDEDFRTFISHTGRKYEFFYYHHNVTGNDEWININRSRWYNGAPYCPGGTLYTKNLNRVFSGTKYQYCQLAEFARHMEYVYSPEYLQSYLDKPCIEYLVKLKMYRLLCAVLKSYNGDLDNPHGKNPSEVLGVSKQDVKTLIRLSVSAPELDLWRWCRRKGVNISENDIRIIQSCDMEVHNFDFLKNIPDTIPIAIFTKTTTFTRYLNYLKKQVKARPQSMSNAGSDWLDYIRNCIKLSYDLDDETILFPRDLKEAHDRVYKLVKISESKADDDKIRAMYLKKMKRYSYRESKYFITVASCADDLIQEGQKMHHCVGTYIGRVAKDQCTILFIRKVSEPDVPLATCEVRGTEAIQIRAKNDEVPPKDVMAFWNRFKESKLKKQPQKQKAENRKVG